MEEFSGIEFNEEGEPIAYGNIESDDDGYGDAANLLMHCDSLEDNELDFEVD